MERLIYNRIKKYKSIKSKNIFLSNFFTRLEWKGNKMAKQNQILFNFENEYKNDLHFIPLAIRYKLDTLGLKIGLDAWLRLSIEERFELLNSPFDFERQFIPEAYRIEFKNLLNEYLTRRGEPEAKIISIINSENWSKANPIPDCVLKSMHENGLIPENLDWNSLSELKRFILWKLALSARQKETFPKAFEEFRG